MAKDGKEYIIEVNDCATTLMGESQEEDRKNIAELVLKEMEVSTMSLFNKLIEYTFRCSCHRLYHQKMGPLSFLQIVIAG